MLVSAELGDGISEVESSGLRLKLQVVEMLQARDSAAVVQAWFQGLNPRLEDRSPARLLSEGGLEEVGPQILAAARAFAAS